MLRQKRTRKMIAASAIAAFCAAVLWSICFTPLASASAAGSPTTENAFGSTAASQPGAPVLQAAGVTISGQPQNVTVAVGDTATFTVTASGTSLTYQWQCKAPGSSSWSNSTQTGAKTKTLSVVTNVNHNGYQYRCVIKSGNTQMISNVATLTVIPKFIMQSANQRALVGETATFTVSAAGKGTLTYQWQCKSPTATSWSNSTQTGAKTASLSVTTNVNHEGYKYRCVVTDANGKKAYSNAASLAVAPKFTTQPKSTSVTVGDTATFTVVAKGKATFTYQWQCKEPGATSWRDSALGTAKSAKLSIKTDTGYNGYQYRCIVTDGNNRKTTSNAVTLTITPKITTQPSNVNAKAGTTVTFTVVAKGKATLKYQWQYKAPNSSSWKNSTQSSATTSKLSFTATVNHQGYRYRCVVTDGNGKKVTSNEATISVFGITKQPISYSVPKGILAQFSVTAIGTGLTYQWQVKESANSEWRNSAVSGNKTAKIAFNAYDVNNGYQYRCIVTDSQGRTVTSNVAKLTIGELAIDEHNFPDPVFRDVISGVGYWGDWGGFDTDGNGKLSREEILAVKSVRLHYVSQTIYQGGFGVTNLSGIEYFINLESLSVEGNNLKTLFLRRNTELKSLYCGGCNLTTLDIRGLSKLEYLDCNQNQLKQLDLSQSTALKELSCRDNDLSELPISGLVDIEKLECSGNQLSALDVHALTKLTELRCSNNNITSLDVSNCTAIVELECGGNQLSSLNVSALAELYQLSCENNQLSSLVLGELPELVGVDCGNNKLTSINLGGLSALRSLTCKGNQLETINLNGMSDMYYMDCRENQLVSLNLSGCTNLNRLLCQHNKLKSLPLAGMPNIKYLYCGNNQITELTIEGCPGLLELGCEANGMTLLNVENCPELKCLYCCQNELKSISLGNNTELFELVSFDNKLTSLDVSNNAKLMYMDTDINTFDTIDLSQNPEIRMLYCDAMGMMKQPQSYRMPAGGKAVFSVLVCGTELSYQWQVKTSANGEWKNVSDSSAKTNVLQFIAQTSQNGYQYRCVITNKNGKTITSDSATLTVGDIAINETTFPDENFRSFVSEFADTDKNGSLSLAEIRAVTEMKVNSPNTIYSVDGIEYFVYLKSLSFFGDWWSGNCWLNTLDLDRNLELTDLDCSYTGVSSLNIRNNVKLTTLTCDFWGNNYQLLYLDLTNNVNLKKLQLVGQWGLRLLDLRKNTELEELDIVGFAPINGQLDLSNNKKLKRLRYDDNGVKYTGLGDDVQVETVPDDFWL